MNRTPLGRLLHRYDRQICLLCRAGFALSILTVCILSLLPAEELPKVRPWDKISHLIAYAEITAIGLLGFRRHAAALPIMIGVTALGGVLEIAQHYVPGRSSDWLDFAVNTLGVVVGFVLARLALKLFWPTHSEARPGRPAP